MIDLTLSSLAMTSETLPYHREDLEAELLRAATAIIAERGVEALSLRELGRAAQVSRSAPYHYFGDKAALLQRVGALGFARLDAAIAAQVSTAAPVAARLHAGLRAYVQFALDEPAIFRLMFADVLHRDVASGLDLPGAEAAFSSTAAAGAFGGFVAAIAEAQARGELGPGDPMLITNTCWAFAHGVAQLAIGRNLKPAASLDAVFDAGIAALLVRFGGRLA